METTTTLTISQAAAIFAEVLILTFIVETLVEAIFGMWIEKMPKLVPFKKEILKSLAWMIGVGLGFGFQVDIITPLVTLVNNEYVSHAAPWLLYLITGLSLGQGSSFVHQLMEKVAPQNKERLGAA